MRRLVVLLKTLFMAAGAVVIFGFVTRQLRPLDAARQRPAPDRGHAAWHLPARGLPLR